jgi:hypothetical protein
MAQFPKGASGNPGGRPSIPDELKAKLKDGYAEAVDFWINTLRDDEMNWDYRNKAATNIAAYAYGKPKEIIDMDISGKLEGITVAIVDKSSSRDT